MNEEYGCESRCSDQKAHHISHLDGLELRDYHNLQLVTDISTRLLVMDHGSIVKNIINDSPSAAEELRDYFAG